jgi:hypothetical protein
MMEELTIKAREQGLELAILFEDEARFGRVQDPKRCWAKKGFRPQVKAQMIREYTYAYGAVEPINGKLTSLNLPHSDSACMSIFLKEVAVQYANKYVVMFMDQASWHRSKELEIPKNIHLLYLPPYSPELNPVEMAWKSIRKAFFHNTYFNSLEAVEDRLVQALQHFFHNPNELKTTCGFHWIVNPILSAT